MNRATAEIRNLAKRLADIESEGKKSSEARTLGAFHACEKLRPSLASLMGNGGFRALFSRALALAGAEIPWLRVANVKADGYLEGLEELDAKANPEKIFEGGVVLLAQLLGLLVAFIGESLTLRLVREVWPEVSVSDLNSGKGGKNEKTK
jgi:hypothetical protein